MTIRIKDGIYSLTGTNGGLLRVDSRMLTGEMDLEIGKVDEALELTLLINDLTA